MTKGMSYRDMLSDYEDADYFDREDFEDDEWEQEDDWDEKERQKRARDEEREGEEDDDDDNDVDPISDDALSVSEEESGDEGVNKALTEQCTQEYEDSHVEEKTKGWAKYTNEEWLEIIHDFKLGKQCRQCQTVAGMSQEEIEDAKYKGEIAGQKIANALRPFIIFLAHKYYSSYFQRFGQEMIDEGFCGVYESIVTFDPAQGKPTTWCSRSIIHNLRDFVDSRVHHTTPHYQGTIQKIKRFIAQRQSEGKPWTLDDLAIELDVPPATLLACITIDKRNVAQMSTDQRLGDTQTTVGEMVAKNICDPETECIQKMQAEKIRNDMKKCLTTDEFKVLWYKYGFDGSDQRSNAEVEEVSGIPKQNIKSLLNSGQFKLKQYMSMHGNGYSSERITRTKQHVITSEAELKKALLTMMEMNHQYDFSAFSDIPEEPVR